MHKLKFFGSLLLVIISILALVFFLNRQAFETVYYNRSALAEGSEWVEKTYSLAGLVDYIDENPQNVSVTSLNLTYPDQSIHYQEDTPRVMGATGHIILLGAWIKAETEGLYPADSLITLDDIEQLQLPNIAASSHQISMNYLREKSTDGEVELKHVAQTMIKNNHLASADFMFNLLGHERVKSFTESQLGSNVEAPLPWSAFYILAQPMLHGEDSGDRISELNNMPDNELQNKILDQFDAFQNDEEFHQQVNQAFGGDGHNLNFTEQRELYNLLPEGTTSAFAGFSKSILDEEFVSPEASQKMYDILSWPMEEGSTRRHLNRYGAVYDDRMSILGGIDMGESQYTNERYAQAILYDELPIGLWMHMSSNFMNQDYQKRLMYDPELHRRTISSLNNQ